VGEGREGKSAVSKPHPLGIVAEHLVRSLYDHALMLGHRLSARFLNAFFDDELMYLGHIRTLHD
jgi:hypothetical protein